MSAEPHVISKERTESRVAQRTFVSWSAILAGLVVAIATTWLLSLLGTAIGISILDGTDAQALDSGFGIAATVFMLATGLIAFFVGGLVTGRFCGQDDRQAGALHGITMWSAAAIVMLVLGYLGVAGLINTGSAIVGNATQAVSVAVPALSDSLATQDVDRQMSPAQRNDLTRVSATIKQQIASAIAESGGMEGQEQTIRQAMDQLDADTIRDIGVHYLAGDPEAARDELALNTILSEQQVDTLAANLQETVQQNVDQYRERIDKTMETATTYAQAVLWTSFITVLLGLVVAMIGGMIGCRAAVKMHTVAVAERRVAA